MRRSVKGHEDAFPRPRLSARCRFSQGTFAGTWGNGRDAPIPGPRSNRRVRTAYRERIGGAIFPSLLSNGENPDVSDSRSQRASSSQLPRTERRSLRAADGALEPPLAPSLIRHGKLSDGDRVIDVGCVLPECAKIEAAIGVDLAADYAEAACARNTDRRITFQEADARELPFGDDFFDRAFSMLVLNFILNTQRAVADMRRVVRPGGTVTAVVWNTFSGLTHWRMMWDIAVALDPYLVPALFSPMTAPHEMATLGRELGMVQVEQISLLIRMEFSSFEDYWRPFTTGEGFRSNTSPESPM